MDPRVLTALSALVLLGCGGPADQFEGNTDRAALELTVHRVVNADLDKVTEDRRNVRLRYVLPVLARNLPVGAEVYLRASASEIGRFRFGSGWITKGSLYFGRHGVVTEIAGVRSGDPSVVSAQILREPEDPGAALVKLVGLKPGSARITFIAWKLDQTRHRRGSGIEDSVELRVIEPSVSAGAWGQD